MLYTPIPMFILPQLDFNTVEIFKINQCIENFMCTIDVHQKDGRIVPLRQYDVDRNNPVISVALDIGHELCSYLQGMLQVNGFVINCNHTTRIVYRLNKMSYKQRLKSKCGNEFDVIAYTYTVIELQSLIQNPWWMFWNRTSWIYVSTFPTISSLYMHANAIGIKMEKNDADKH